MPKIGLIAAWGRFPIIVAEALKRNDFEVYCMGIHAHADEDALRAVCDDYQEGGIAKLGGHLRYFKRNGVTLATMAGKMHKTILYEPRFWLKHLPDWRFVRTFWPHFITMKKDFKDDTLMLSIIEQYQKDGIHMAPATDFAPELLIRSGVLGKHQVSARKMADIEFGWNIAKEMGRLDVGQSIIVKDRAIIAVEAVEGTDACILRAGDLVKRGGFTLVKVAKPEQDMRFDVPTIGVGTLENLRQAGGTILAVEAGKTIILDEPEVIAYANKHGIALIACEASAFEQKQPQAAA